MPGPLNLARFIKTLVTSESMGSAQQLLKYNFRSIDYIQMRQAGKSPAQSQKGFKRKHLIFSLLKNPGDRVDERMVLGTQKRLNYHPGLNVALNPRDKSLYALCAGTVYYSIERFQPNHDHPLVKQYYSTNPELVPYYRKYVHVVPDKLTQEFKMVDIV